MAQNGRLAFAALRLRAWSAGKANISVLLLSAILILALSLRLWGIGFGLPFKYHYDEPYYVTRALKFGAGILDAPPYAPTGFANVLLGEYGVFYVVGRVLGVFDSASAFERLYRTDPSSFHIMGRVTSALFGTLTVAIVYALGWARKRELESLIGALFMAVAFLHVRDSHYAATDVALAFWISLTVLLCTLAVRSQKGRILFWAGVTGGITIATKWTALPVLLPVLWSTWMMMRQTRRGLASYALQGTLVLLAVAVGFAVFSPQVLINPWPYLAEAKAQYAAGEAGGFEIWVVDTVPGWVFYGKTLFHGLSGALVLFAVPGMLLYLIQALRRNGREVRLLLSFPIVYFLLMGSTRHYFIRYAMPLMPFAVLFAAEAVVAVGTWVKTRWPKLGSALLVTLTVVGIGQPLACSIRHDSLLTRKDTRTLAKEWIEVNIPAGAKIALDWPVHGPPLSTPETGMPLSRRTYDVLIVGGTGLSDHPVEWYREQGFEYLIASSFIYDISLVYKDRDVKRREFYASLDRDLQLVADFRPYTSATAPPFIFDEILGPFISLWQRDRPGPTIKVYTLGGS